jgi:glutathionyl-hydroquinone reductase
VLGIERLKDAYEAGSPATQGHHRPGDGRRALGAGRHQRLPQITLDLSTEWTEHHRDGAPDLYPEAHLRDEIDEVMELVYRDVNNGVYKCGFAGLAGEPTSGPTTAVRPARLARPSG